MAKFKQKEEKEGNQTEEKKVITLYLPNASVMAPPGGQICNDIPNTQVLAEKSSNMDRFPFRNSYNSVPATCSLTHKAKTLKFINSNFIVSWKTVSLLLS